MILVKKLKKFSTNVNFNPEVMLKHTELVRELSFAEKNPRHLVHSPEKIVKAISDHVRLAYGKNKRSSSMGMLPG